MKMSSLLSMPSDETFVYLFKIVLIGNWPSGWKPGRYEDRHGNTIGVRKQSQMKRYQMICLPKYQSLQVRLFDQTWSIILIMQNMLNFCFHFFLNKQHSLSLSDKGSIRDPFLSIYIFDNNQMIIKCSNCFSYI